MLIKNRDALGTTELRNQALDIIEAGIERVLPINIMKSAASYSPASKIFKIKGRAFHLSQGRLFVIGGGKAAGLMAETLEKIIPPGDITAGTVNCKDDNYQTSKIKIRAAGHPMPDVRGIEGVKEMLALKQRYSIDKKDLVLCLISGGGSALMPFPVEGVILEDKQRITELLLCCGAAIDEINMVRKHLSAIKGGQLGRYFSPAAVVSLIISDVIGNDLAVIASGPAFPDPTTFQDAYDVLKKYDLLSQSPESVVTYLEKGCRDKTLETPKILNNCNNYIIGDNSLALEAMKKKARELGFAPIIVTAEQKGDTTYAACARANEILSSKYAGYNAIIIGGETAPKLPPAAGTGGRNQHYAAVSMPAMEQYPGEWVLASIGTDGSDFLPDVAGAVIDNTSLSRLIKRNVDIRQHIECCDSYTLLKTLSDSLIVTGNTGTNVGDVILYLLK